MSDGIPVAIIAGVPLGVYRRSRCRPTRPGWNIQVLPSQDHAKCDLKSIWQRVLNQHDDMAGAGVHLLLAHGRQDEHPIFRDVLKERSCRAMWLSDASARQYGDHVFVENVNRLLEFEERWRASLRPTQSSPLLLPEPSFAARRSVREMWTRVRRTCPNHDSLEHIGKLIQRFVEIHRRMGVWRDQNALTFDPGPRHGDHLPPWQRRKLTFTIPVGFHFDVKHERERAFNVVDATGARHGFSRYTNVDPHGHIRGGR